MSIFENKLKYGRFGELTRNEWIEKLESKDPLFKITNKNTNPIIGPSLTDSGTIVGDALVMESTLFGSSANEEQQKFYNQLLKDNITAAKEYLLYVSGAINKWKEDMEILELTDKYLKIKNSKIKNEEKILEKLEKLDAHLKLPEILKKHVKKLFDKINFSNEDSFEEVMKKLENAHQFIEHEEEKIENYISKTKKELPFLFEK